MNAATLPESAPDWQARYRASDLEQLFHETFFERYQTCLIGGADEPVYVPGGAPEQAHRIVYTRDYFRSALHEVAHWCVAGPTRRRQADYGYWYAPDGRNAEQQQAFMQVEVAPQALELLFCAACAHPFQVSLDNLDGDAGDEAVFRQQVVERALAWLPSPGGRAGRWIRTLAAFYRGRAGLDAQALEQVMK